MPCRSKLRSLIIALVVVATGSVAEAYTVVLAPVSALGDEADAKVLRSAAEVGHGWLPQWVIRLGQMITYVSGTTPKLKYTPLEYVQQGRFMCAAEPFEGPEMTKACIDILGDGALMHQSDYPHGEAFFPDTAGMVVNWPIWSTLGEQALRKHMFDNAAAFLRLI